VIARFLDEVSLDTFRTVYLGRHPYVRPDTAAPAVPLLDWRTVERLVDGGADLLLVRNGRSWSGPLPRTYREARRAFGDGYSIVLRGCERIDPGLQGLADSVAGEFEGQVAVQVFATPAGFRSFGWHYDCEDVFIVQTEGTKEYRLRQNTVNPRPTLESMPRDMQFERETTPVVAATLTPGDWLFVPRGWWHSAGASADSLSLSIGVLGPEASGTAAPRRAWEADAAARTASPRAGGSRMS
jgi:50S ribosomal protein L16 3-hydroxylase